VQLFLCQVHLSVVNYASSKDQKEDDLSIEHKKRIQEDFGRKLSWLFFSGVRLQAKPKLTGLTCQHFQARDL
jgi:hypothetical protein